MLPDMTGATSLFSAMHVSTLCGKGNTMILVEVTVPDAHAEEVQQVIEQCCQQTGDTLLGRRHYPDIGELFLVVQLRGEEQVSEHLPVLRQALQQKLILCFTCTQATLVKVTSSHIFSSIESFPLSVGDSWVPSAQEPDTVYLAINRLMLTPSQAAWLHLYEVEWSYVSSDLIEYVEQKQPPTGSTEDGRVHHRDRAVEGLLSVKNLWGSDGEEGE